MNSKTNLIMAFLGTLIFGLSMQAEVLHWVQNCDSGELVVTNSANKTSAVWLQKFAPDLTDETFFEMTPFKKLHIPIKNPDRKALYSLLHFEKSISIKAVFECGALKYPASSLEGGVLTFKSPSELVLQNIYSDENEFTLETLDSNKNSLKTLHFKLQPKTSEIIPVQASYVRVSAVYKMSAFSISPTGSKGADQVDVQKNFVPLPEGTYFEVGPRSGSGDTFTVFIQDPQLIAKARLQITDPTLEKIVFAQVTKGHGNFNRNRSKSEKSFWSWSTTQVTNISDLGSTSCNGIPQLIEDSVDHWINTNGRICFWNYRIKKELTAKDVIEGSRFAP